MWWYFYFYLGQQWRLQIKTAGDSPESQKWKRTLVIYGSKGKSDDILLSPQSPGQTCFLPRAMDEFLVSHKYITLTRNYNDALLSQKIYWNVALVATSDIFTYEVIQLELFSACHPVFLYPTAVITSYCTWLGIKDINKGEMWSFSCS